MDERAAIRARLLRSRNGAAVWAERFRTAETPDRDLFRLCLRGYVLEKYMLTERDAAECGSFDALVERSIAKSMQISAELVSELESAQSCGGATSSETKKVLLFLAVQRDFSLELPAEKTPYIRTLDDLADLAWEAMQKNKN